MKYGSVCSGVEAATVAWRPLGWEPQWFCEFDDFPSAVLAHHYPEIPNLGDMTKIREKEIYRDKPIDLLVGGTPCQSFSVAGLGKGLDDDRGNLALEYCRILKEKQPRWFVWENVPGVLSSNGGKDFGSILGAMVECGYGVAYRVLDAQYFGVPQRRRRVFVVGYLGDWRPPAGVLFEQDCLQRDITPSRKKKQNTATKTQTDSDKTVKGYRKLAHGKYTDDETASTSKARDYKGATDLVVHGTQDPIVSDQAHTLGCNHGQENVIYENHPSDSRIKKSDVCPTITKRWGTGGGNVPYAIAGNTIGRKPENGGNGKGFHENTSYTLTETDVHGVVDREFARKLIPRECEYLQGFPGDYTKIPWNNKTIDDCPDGHRYKATGNSMPVVVMKWLGQRIDLMNQVLLEIKNG